MNAYVPPKVYIAGPMTGIPQFNFPAFDLAAEGLRGFGFEVVSPAELDDPDDRAAALASPDGKMNGGHHMNKTHGDFLARDVKLISDGGIEAVWVLPGWRHSTGALMETFVAHLRGLPIINYGGANHGELVDASTRVSAWARGLWREVELAVLREALNDRPARSPRVVR